MAREHTTIRGLRSAASLKLQEIEVNGVPIEAIRGLRSAASLKRPAFSRKKGRLYAIRGLRSAASLKRQGQTRRTAPARGAPRTQIRGLIEAVSPQNRSHG